jgi:hypothetical protein
LYCFSLYAGLLVSLPAALHPLVQSARQPRQTNQQQRCGTQQQQAAAENQRLLVLRGLLETAHHVLRIVDQVLCAPAEQCTPLRAALPLLQQLQRCGPLLMAGSAGAGPGAAVAGRAGSSSSSSSGSNSVCEVQQWYVRVQHLALQVLKNARVLHLNETLHLQARPHAATLHCDPAVTELLLQAAAGHAMLLHKEHEDNISAQQQQEPSSSSSSGGSSSGGSSASAEATRMLPHKKHRADLLPIPAFHQHLHTLQLLPGGQVYLDVAAALSSATGASSQGDSMGICRGRAHDIIDLLEASLTISGSTGGGQQLHAGAPLLSAAAILLVLELQLLAAGEVQRQQALQHSTEGSGKRRPDQLLMVCNVLLHEQIVAFLDANGSCLPPEVLQQAGLQLLQALAALLQQLQLGNPDHPSVGAWQQAWRGMPSQLYVLQAAVGLAVLPGREGEQASGRDARICTCGLQANGTILACALYQDK